MSQASVNMKVSSPNNASRSRRSLSKSSAVAAASSELFTAISSVAYSKVQNKHTLITGTIPFSRSNFFFLKKCFNEKGPLFTNHSQVRIPRVSFLSQKSKFQVMVLVCFYASFYNPR